MRNAPLDAAHTVDIVVPVFGGLHHALDCLESIRLHTTVSHRLTVVDDGSGPEVARRLGQFLLDGWHRRDVTLLVHQNNRGFVHAANSGMRHGTAPVVALVNSDVLVTAGWLDGLMEALDSAPDVGIVCPLSNHANLTRLDVPWGPTPDQMAAAVRTHSPRSYPEIGIASGFCLLARRSLLDRLDFFDEAYAPGYFEEADLCMRAAQQGWRTIADDATFIHHHGWATFGAEDRTALMNRNLHLFRERWGDAHEHWRDLVREAKPFADLTKALGTELGGRPVSTARWTADINAPSKGTAGRNPPASGHARQRPPQPSVLLLLAEVAADPVTADWLRLLTRLPLEGIHATVGTWGNVDESLYADPLSLRPVVAQDRASLLRLLPPPDLLLEGTQPEGLAPWVDDALFGTVRRSPSPCAAVALSTIPDESALRALRDVTLAATAAGLEVSWYGVEVSGEVPETSLGMLTMRQEADLLARCGVLVCRDGEDPHARRAFAAGVPVAVLADRPVDDDRVVALPEEPERAGRHLADLVRAPNHVRSSTMRARRWAAHHGLDRAVRRTAHAAIEAFRSRG